MANYAITGKLGGGKSLVTVCRMVEALKAGRVVATNIDLNLGPVFGKYSKVTYLRVPDKPTLEDFEVVGIGNSSYDEDQNGILALDELGTWFNARGWQDKGRQEIINWFLHMRKRGWDGYFIIQDVENMDSQARRALVEMTAFCKRLDRVAVPFLGPIVRFFTGKTPRLPKLHVARIVYGTSPTDLKIDRWAYQGKNVYNAYDTKQIFVDNYPHGVHSVLSPWHLNRNQIAKRNWDFYMRLTRIYWKRFRSPVSMATGVLLGISAAVLYFGKQKVEALQPVAFEMPSLISEATAAEPQQLDPYTQKIRDVVAGLSIAGYRQINGEKVYELSSATDEEKATQFTSLDLAQMGVIIHPRGQCHFDAQIGTETLPVLCQLSL